VEKEKNQRKPKEKNTVERKERHRFNADPLPFRRGVLFASLFKPQGANAGDELPLGPPGTKQPGSEEKGRNKDPETEGEEHEEIDRDPPRREEKDRDFGKMEGKGKRLAKELKVRKINPEEKSEDSKEKEAKKSL
jgi:hypothetical protein